MKILISSLFIGALCFASCSYCKVEKNYDNKDTVPTKYFALVFVSGFENDNIRLKYKTLDVDTNITSDLSTGFAASFVAHEIPDGDSVRVSINGCNFYLKKDKYYQAAVIEKFDNIDITYTNRQLIFE